MSGPSPAGPQTAGPQTAGPVAAPVTRSPSALWAVGAFVAWTLFVWIGRIRNALTDPELTGSDRIGPLVLSTVFVVGAIVLGAVLYRDHVAATPASARTLRLAARVVGGYTIAVWVVRAADIALAGDHEAAFVAVHLVLAAISIGLAVWAALAADRRYAHISSVIA
ncbi:hypothetical protein [Dermatobacter hominis]|uniref:hypothetical protein n=1 Tax=Dermatobacter hominis TaxID=2884263 RepID=UPI001D127860|nr:hypothetical protein [Dermatobacter hominis]UDY37008.1 hypothetical protein LH044_05590 [Dermatobacter hominis]